MPTVSTYLTTEDMERLKRFCERRSMKPYGAIRMLMLKGMTAIEQGIIRDEEGAGGINKGLGSRVSDVGAEIPAREGSAGFYRELGKWRKKGE